MFESSTNIYYKYRFIYTLKIMKFEEKNCDSCPYKNSCAEVYRKLGNSKAEPVAIKVILAFLLPLVVFIVALAVSEKILGIALEAKWLAMILSFLAAAAVTSLFVLIVRLISKHFAKSL